MKVELKQQPIVAYHCVKSGIFVRKRHCKLPWKFRVNDCSWEVVGSTENDQELPGIVVEFQFLAV